MLERSKSSYQEDENVKPGGIYVKAMFLQIS